MSLFHCPNLHVSKNAIWRVYRVPRSSRLTSIRTYYVPVPPGEDSAVIKSQEEKADRLSGTWYIPDPANVDLKSVLARFPQLPPIRRRRLTSALFLVTPKLAKWFEVSHPFYQSTINHIYQPIASDSPPESIVAVVDALPSPRIPDGIHPLPSHEGIAICLSPDKFSTREFMEIQSEQSLIRFHTAPAPENGVPGSMISVTLPTANTLFVNGLSSTMFKQTWTQGQEGEVKDMWVPKDDPVHLSSLDIVMPFTSTLFRGVYVPMQPITPARRIVSSMGNVLRELEGDDGKTLRGSTELESNVPEFIKKMGAQGLDGTVKVFALVMPPSSSADDSEVQDQSAATAVAENETETSSSSSSQPLTTTRGNINGFRIIEALRLGGRVVRVTGGGGGWGKKQGLLSLDDKVNFNTDESLESGMFPSFDEEIVDQPLITPQELLQPGHTIQFFAAWVGPAGSYKDVQRFMMKDPAGSYTARSWSQIKEQKWILGTNLASEDARIQMRDAEPVEIDKMTAGVYTVARYFGMLSNNGICLAREAVKNVEDIYTTASPKYNTIHQSRLDVPHSVIRCSWKGPSPPQDLSFAGEQEPKRSKFDRKFATSRKGGFSDGIARAVRSKIRDDQGRIAKTGKSRNVKVAQEMSPGHYYRARDVVGYQKLDKTFRLIVPSKRSPEEQPEADVRKDRSDGVDDTITPPSRANSSAPNRSDRAEGLRDHAPETRFEPYASGEPEHTIVAENLDPIFTLYHAPNDVSWDQPRANVKPGRDRS